MKQQTFVLQNSVIGRDSKDPTAGCFGFGWDTFNQGTACGVDDIGPTTTVRDDSGSLHVVWDENISQRAEEAQSVEYAAKG